MGSSSRRSRRNDKPKNKQQSSRGSKPATSRTGSEISCTAPTYSVSEDSDGQLINKRLNLAWPALVSTRESKLRADGKIKYQRGLDSEYSSSSASDASDAETRQFATSPYEMISIAELDAAAAKADGGGGADKPRRSSKKSRVRRGRDAAVRGNGDNHSPQYVQLSSKSEDETEYEQVSPRREESSMKIDSIVFNTQAELEHYQRVLGKQLQHQNKSRRNSESTTSRASTPSNRAERDETARHFIGIKTQRSVDKRLRPGDFFMYYDKPVGVEIPVTIELKIGYMDSKGKISHFPIQRFERRGESFYAVIQNDMDVKMFPSIDSLVQHYHSFSHDDPSSGRAETFEAVL